MQLELTNTAITKTHIHMRYADSADQPTAWIDFRLPLAELRNPWDEARPFGDPEIRIVGEVHLAALRAARAIVSEETQRLSVPATYSR